MRIFPAIRITVAMLISTTTFPVFANDCEKGATNMAQIRECSSIELDQRLATSFNRTLSYIRNKDQKAAELLTVAQKSWQKFAEDSCEFSTASRQTSQLANDSRLKCRQSFIEARIRILDSYLMNFGRKDKLR